MGVWDWGGAGTGATAGWGLGSIGGPAGSGAGALLGSLFGGMFGGRSTPGQGPGYDIVPLPQYGFTEPRLGLTSDFLSGEIERIMRGDLPGWYEGIEGTLREQGRRGLKETYMGVPGLSPGILERQKSFDVSRGLGKGAAATRGYGAQLDRWAQGEKQIEEELMKMGAAAQEKGAYEFPRLSMMMPKGPDTAVLGPYGGQAPQMSEWDKIMGSLAGAAPWMSQQAPAFDLGAMFSGKAGAGAGAGALSGYGGVGAGFGGAGGGFEAGGPAGATFGPEATWGGGGVADPYAWFGAGAATPPATVSDIGGNTLLDRGFLPAQIGQRVGELPRTIGENLFPQQQMNFPQTTPWSQGPGGIENIMNIILKLFGRRF